jgi:tetratricopeptide (TPR) repeat protein
LLSAWFLISPAAQAGEAEQVREAFRQKESEFRKQPADSNTAWQFGQACFDLADLATNKTERAEIAQLGIDACRKSITINSNSAASHYYLALNQGQLARTRMFGALKLVSQMERELSAAIELDSRFDYGGPERTLGLLYRDAPSIGSIGSRSKARQHLQRAVELAPLYPDNRLSLIESYLKWGDREAARRELKALKKGWERARLELSGSLWKASWEDWEERLQQAEKKLEEASKPLEAPRTKG